MIAIAQRASSQIKRPYLDQAEFLNDADRRLISAASFVELSIVVEAGCLTDLGVCLETAG